MALALVGCGEESQSTKAATSTSADASIANVKMIEQENGGVKYKVPADWDASTNDSYIYYYPENLPSTVNEMVMSHYDEISNFAEDDLKEVMNSYVDGLSESDTVGNLVKEDSTIQGQYAIKATFLQIVDGVAYNTTAYAVPINKHAIFSIGFCSNGKAEKNYQPYYDRIVDSITLPQNLNDIDMTNQKIGGVNYQVPADWDTRQETDDGDIYIYYSPKTSSKSTETVLACYSEMTNLTDDNLENVIGACADSVAKTDDVSNFVKEDYPDLGEYAIKSTFTQEIDGESYDAAYYVFPVNMDGLFSLLFYSRSGNHVYEPYYNLILDSIELPAAKAQSESSEESSTEEVSAATSSEKTATSESDLTTERASALQMAAEYLEYTAFSHDGLVDQLEYEGFSTEDATYAADNCGADWNEQAARMAQQYRDYSTFSHAGLVDQLEYEGFSAEQAEYGASATE